MLLIGHEQLSTLPAARQHAGRLWDHKLAGDTPGECAVLAALSASAVTGDASASVTNDLLDRALRGGLAGMDQSQMLVSLAGLAFVTTDRLDDAAARFDQIADVGGRWGSFLMLSAATMWQLMVRARRGQQLALIPDFGHPATTTGEGVEHRVRLGMMAQVGESLLERCDPAAAERVLVPDADTDRAGWLWQGPMLLVRSRVHAARGNPAAALAVLLEYGAQEKRAQVANPTVTPWRSRAALLHLALGQRADALRLAAEELELAHRWGTERVIGVVSRCLGVVLGGPAGEAFLREPWPCWSGLRPAWSWPGPSTSWGSPCRAAARPTRPAGSSARRWNSRRPAGVSCWPVGYAGRWPRSGCARKPRQRWLLACRSPSTGCWSWSAPVTATVRSPRPSCSPRRT